MTATRNLRDLSLALIALFAFALAWPAHAAADTTIVVKPVRTAVVQTVPVQVRTVYKPVRVASTAPRTCRTVSQEVYINGDDHTEYTTACRRANGAWTITNVRLVDD